MTMPTASEAATVCVHGGEHPETATGAVTTPIFQSTTYLQHEFATPQPWLYSRLSNPTRAALEEALALLEGGSSAATFASGVAAIHAVMQLLPRSSHVLVTEDVYGGSELLFREVLRDRDLQFEFVDMREPEKVAAALRADTRLLWVESPTNPLLHLVDIAALVDLVKGRDILVAVDNTFASPIFQNPLALGADIVVHSTTKYIGGHGDLVGGAVITKRQDLDEKLKFLQFATGAVNSPIEAYLLLRSIKTLQLRMEKHQENAARVASALQASPHFHAVSWPGLPSHPQHELAQRQMRGYPGMIAARLRGGEEKFRTFVRKLKIFRFTASLGSVDSLVNHPATLTHAHIDAARKQKLNISGDLMRLSIGVEDADDLIADLLNAVE